VEEIKLDFNELLKKGDAAANDYEHNHDQLSQTLIALAESISSFLDCKLNILRMDETKSTDKGLGLQALAAFTPKEKTGFTNVYLVNPPTKEQTIIFKLKYSSDVYPVTIAYDKEHTVTASFEDFQVALGEIISSTSFHLKLRNLKSRIVSEEKALQTKKGHKSP
tara:strand:+ start:664 stop:1158 length:495 start_codon:yes stop_codon:yes gene_type:complete